MTSKRVIHKAVRPKRDYINPTLCVEGWQRMQTGLYDGEDNLVAHKASRTSWAKVTCKACLKLRGKRRV